MTKAPSLKAKVSGVPEFRVVLVSAPWSMFHRPSIQLATLRSYLQKNGSYAVISRHLYLNIAQQIGIDLYCRIAKSGWAGEALFAPLLFPRKKEDAARLFRFELQVDGNKSVPDFDNLVTDIKACCERWLADIDLKKISLLGFSVCFSQLIPSLYLASQLKKKKNISIVFGGSSCAGPVGSSLIRHFQQIDYLVNGEGEKPLLQLCRYLSGEQPDLPDYIRNRQNDESCRKPPPPVRLDELPVPDFTPYLEEVRHLYSGIPFMPVIPIEFSRGCSWNRCSFCNLNIQWQGYRHKSSTRVIAEANELSLKNESLSFAFTDNMLPENEVEKFFQGMTDLQYDFSFFGEIRPRTRTFEKLALLKRGGLQSVQVGIESFSTSLLCRMRKGTSAIDNLAIMKYCCACNVLLLGNIITEFPGTTPDEIDETLTNLDFALAYPPLEGASFFLGYGSPVYHNPREFGIRAITAHPKNRMLFPQQYLGKQLVSSYRGDKQLQQRLWKPVREKIGKWQDFYRNRKGASGPALYFRDGGHHLFIHQEYPEKPALLHRLRGSSREIYLSCDQPKTIEEICTSFPHLKRIAIDKFIRNLCNKRLMFREADQILALAVHWDKQHDRL